MSHEVALWWLRVAVSLGWQAMTVLTMMIEAMALAIPLAWFWGRRRA